MSLNATPSGERVHIAFFGRRNAGKSSLVNAFTGQDLAIVSDVKGTTTDPVSKAMELLPLGPVQIIDTPGLDDEGELGTLRVQRTKLVLRKTDLAILVADATAPLGETEQALLDLCRARNIPWILVRSKADLLEAIPEAGADTIYVSAKTGYHIHELKELAARLALGTENRRPLVSDLLRPGDTAVLVVPIDKAAPKGRLILPQQQVIRDALEAGAAALVCRETELAAALQGLNAPPKLVVTDSQVFGKVAQIVPQSVPLTSFSILMARCKGDLALTVAGAAAVRNLKDGDRVLIAEGCTHHRQCEDIGTVKIPRWLAESTGRTLQYDFCSGVEFPEDLTPYALVVHCGGCTLNPKEMAARQRLAVDQAVPITNYGVLIAAVHGILPRTLQPFPAIAALL
ncbi:MAG TPA: [FeFe] hydrogenase H-cluster maturation GTPase HydF [Candidatus Avoscillospira stercorigallinarum]|uniref:[FeFe] hydrogenase H-cluster maturation GTPase HydF n=1 Tax=Candidatus Avoscillospira stercorigallinarum TaxID=2840708 RepID=A0A9D1CPP2_9FIRM|nr:[FeFe] hydrogenase H-cluster maturation GTPase HydF [Candidatus Avoscillospira stercorigallinarum]